MSSPNLLTTMGNTLPGYELIDTVGVVCAQFQSEPHRSFDRPLNVADGRNKALLELVATARNKGAEGVIGVVFEQFERDWRGDTIYTIVATGIAVKMNKIN